MPSNKIYHTADKNLFNFKSLSPREAFISNTKFCRL